MRRSIWAISVISAGAYFRSPLGETLLINVSSYQHDGTTARCLLYRFLQDSSTPLRGGGIIHF
jgi:hypothetical protein